MSKLESRLAAMLRGMASAQLTPPLAWTPRRRRRILVALTLLAADLLACVAAVCLAATAARATLPIGAVLVSGSLLLHLTFGLYRGFGPSPCERLRLRARAVLLLGCLACVSAGLAGIYAPLAFVAIACPLILVIGYYAETSARTLLITRRLWGAPAVFVGCGRANRQLAGFLMAHPEFAINPVGSVRLPLEQNGPSASLLPLLGDVGEIETIAPRVEILVFGSADDAVALSPQRRRRLNTTELVIVGEATEVQSLWVNPRMLGSAIGLELRCDLRRRWAPRVKRLMDLALTIPACILLAPIIALAAVAIRFADGGPSFYAQDRIGADGTRLRIWKLRTMFRDAEQRLEAHLAASPQARAQWTRFFKLTDDPRVLPGVGTFLRRTSIDELPQLWTVITGQMSLVGPRPFPSYHTSSFDSEFQALRTSVPPGLSGLWQVGARSDGDLEVQRAQDLFYILNWSIWLDLYILVETPLAVLGKRGAR